MVPFTLPEPFPADLVEAYLLRLGVSRPDVPDLAALTTLLAAHLDRVCYENIDVKLQRALPPLDALSSAQRVAVQCRGGYCFILVGAFAGLLRSLGFEVSLHVGVCDHDPPPEHRWGEHVVAIVHLGCGDYVADVGLGEGPRQPFRLEPRAWEEDGFAFALEERPAARAWWFHNPANVTGTVPGMTVDTSTSATGAPEFAKYHRYYWTHEESSYVRGPVVLHRKAGAQGVLSLHGCTLRCSNPQLPGGNQVLATATSRDEWFAMVRETFFMPLEDLSEEEQGRLWAQVLSDHQAWLASKATAPSQPQ